MTSNIKTLFLLSLLSGLILFLGNAMGGHQGLLIAFAFALCMNLGAYWFSDKIVLSAYKAKELNASTAPELYAMVKDLSRAAGIPMPRLYLVPEMAPNAFATGRSPEHAAVAVTEGLRKLLSTDEIRGVLAHEIAHIRNRDTLVQSIAGVLATVIMYLGNFLQFASIFGGSRSEDGERNVFAQLALALLAPIAASLIQFAISRSREFYADATGAEISRSPNSLANALEKLSSYSQQIPMHEQHPETSHMFIVSPFSGGLQKLFSTHPPLEERVRRLRSMDKK